MTPPKPEKGLGAWYKRRGFLIANLTLYGMFRLSGVVTDVPAFFRALGDKTGVAQVGPGEGILELSAKGFELGRWAYGVPLTVLESPVYAANAAYRVGAGASEFASRTVHWDWKGYGQSLKHTGHEIFSTYQVLHNFDRSGLEEIATVTDTIIHQNHPQAAGLQPVVDWQDKYHLSVANPLIGLAVLGYATKLRRRRADKEFLAGADTTLEEVAYER